MIAFHVYREKSRESSRMHLMEAMGHILRKLENESNGNTGIKLTEDLRSHFSEVLSHIPRRLWYASLMILGGEGYST